MLDDSKFACLWNQFEVALVKEIAAPQSWHGIWFQAFRVQYKYQCQYVFLDSSYLHSGHYLFERIVVIAAHAISALLLLQCVYLDMLDRTAAKQRDQHER